MSAVWILVVVILVAVVIAAGIIADMALKRAPKEHWLGLLREAPTAARERLSDEDSGTAPVRQVSFEQIWRHESEVGSGYTDVPDLPLVRKPTEKSVTPDDESQVGQVNG